MELDMRAGSRRELMKTMIAAGTLAAGRLNASPSVRPNILYIHSHDTGRYIQPYGFDVPTPNLQKLAGEGILFRQAFDAAPTCSPSRASLLTGHCRITMECWAWRIGAFR